MPVLRRGGGGPLAPPAARLGVVVAGLRLGLVPGLTAAALLAALLLRRHHTLVRAACLLAAVASLAALLTDGGPVLAGAHVDLALGEPVPGFALGLRADGAGTAVAVMSLVADMAALLAPGRRPRECAALMLCLLGSLTAALAATMLTLATGLELAAAGCLWLLVGEGGLPRRLLAEEGGHRRRACLVWLAVDQAGALCLLAATVLLQVRRQTGDLSALPAAAIPVAVAVPWSLAGCVRLLAPAYAPGLARPHGDLSWYALGGVPTGLIVLVRLLQASGTGLGLAVAATLGGAGVLAALGGSAVALRRRAAPPEGAGRALVLAAAGSVVAAAALPGSPGRHALGTGAAALELAVVAAPLWSGGRGWAALALASAGGLPVGLGTTAIVLELDAAAAHGLRGAPLLLGLGAAALLAAIAAARSVRDLLDAGMAGQPPPGGSHPAVAVPWGARAALAASAAAALVPGTAAGLASWLTGMDSSVALDAGALRGPGGGWAGGYLTVAALVATLATGSALVLAGAPLPGRERRAAPHGRPAPEPAADHPGARGRRGRSWSLLRRPWRRLTPVRHGVSLALAQADDWLVTQPRLAVLVAAVVLATLLIR